MMMKMMMNCFCGMFDQRKIYLSIYLSIQQGIVRAISEAKPQFNIRLNNHRKEINKQNAPLVDDHFKLPACNFNQHTKLILIEQLDNICIDKDLVTLRLKKREDFWFLRLKTLQPDGFNAELNIPNV